MNLPVRRHSLVEADILGIATNIAHGSMEAAYRFLDAVEGSVAGLKFMPLKGSLKGLRDQRLREVRSWSVAGFPNHLILYEVRRDHIFVFAVTHGARRLSTLLKKRS